jgi:hypothetical protein
MNTALYFKDLSIKIVRGATILTTFPEASFKKELSFTIPFTASS